MLFLGARLRLAVCLGLQISYFTTYGMKVSQGFLKWERQFPKLPQFQAIDHGLPCSVILTFKHAEIDTKIGSGSRE